MWTSVAIASFQGNPLEPFVLTIQPLSIFSAQFPDYLIANPGWKLPVLTSPLRTTFLSNFTQKVACAYQGPSPFLPTLRKNEEIRMIFCSPQTPRGPSSGAAWRPMQGCIKTDTFRARAGRGVDSAPWVRSGEAVDWWQPAYPWSIAEWIALSWDEMAHIPALARDGSSEDQAVRLV